MHQKSVHHEACFNRHVTLFFTWITHISIKIMVSIEYIYVLFMECRADRIRQATKLKMI